MAVARCCGVSTDTGVQQVLGKRDTLQLDGSTALFQGQVTQAPCLNVSPGPALGNFSRMIKACNAFLLLQSDSKCCPVKHVKHAS